MLIDSHCHLDQLDLSPFGGKLEVAIAAAREKGVNGFLCVAIDKENQQKVIEIAESFEDIHASTGIHPLYTEGQDADVEYLCAHAAHPKVVAIGETGLDYYYAKESAEKQRSLFRTHVKAAVKTQLPLIVHTRDAQQDTLDILAEEGAAEVGGVLHCFTESLEMAKQAMAMGFYVSFSGIVTFKNADELRQTAKAIPADRLLVETDSPYLTPVPFRGKPNSPQHVCDVARCVAEIRGESYQSLCQQTSENYRRLFSKVVR